MRAPTDPMRLLGAALISLTVLISGPVARSQLAPIAQPSAQPPSPAQPPAPEPPAPEPPSSQPSVPAPPEPASPAPPAPGPAIPPALAPVAPQVAPLPPPGPPAGRSPQAAQPCNPAAFPPAFSMFVSPGYQGIPLSLLPSTLPYEEGQPIPLGYEVKTRATRRLLITGAIAFTATYLPSAIAGGAVANAADYVGWGEPLLIPLAGPFVAVGTAHTRGLFTLALVLDGLVQTAGAAFFITGLVIDETILSRIRVRTLGLPAPTLLVGPGSAALRWQF